MIIVTWTVTDEIVTKLSLEIQEGGNSAWEAVIGATDMSTFKSEFKVKNTKAHQKYKFRMDMRRPGEEGSCFPCYVYSNTGRFAIQQFDFTNKQLNVARRKLGDNLRQCWPAAFLLSSSGAALLCGK